MLMSVSTSSLPTALDSQHRWRLMVAPVVFVGVSAVILGLIGSLIASFLVGAIVGVALAIVLTVIAVVKADAVVVWITQASLAPESDYRRLHNVVEGLCVTIGVQKPQVYVISDVAPNALVIAQGSSRNAIAVTTGLVNKLDRIQLEGVVAQLVSRLRSGEVGTLTRVSVLLGAPVIIGELLQRKKYSDGGREPREGDRGVSQSAVASFASGVGLLLMKLGYVIGPLMKWIGGTSSDIAADIAACRLTRYPPGLAQALEVVSHDRTVVRSTSMTIAHLWFVESLSGVGDAGRHGGLHNLFTSHSPVGERVALLKEM